VVVIGAGCIGGAIARELSKHKLSVLVVEGAFIANFLYAWMSVDVC
jgi:glycine/D-amino acid oxidase-like deaminating enzyme